jgi:hypothetical protein
MQVCIVLDLFAVSYDAALLYLITTVIFNYVYS